VEKLMLKIVGRKAGKTCLLLCSSVSALLCQTQANVAKEPLRGISGLMVVVGVEKPCGDIVDSGLVKQDIELRLRHAALKIVENPLPAYLFAEIGCAHVKLQGGEHLGMAAATALELNQKVFLSPDPLRPALAITWTDHNIMTCSSEATCGDKIRASIRDSSDKFVSDVLEMNAK
jgi:hypothetical protein